MTAQCPRAALSRGPAYHLWATCRPADVCPSIHKSNHPFTLLHPTMPNSSLSIPPKHMRLLPVISKDSPDLNPPGGLFSSDVQNFSVVFCLIPPQEGRLPPTAPSRSMPLSLLKCISMAVPLAGQVSHVLHNAFHLHPQQLQWICMSLYETPENKDPRQGHLFGLFF